MKNTVCVILLLAIAPKLLAREQSQKNFRCIVSSLVGGIGDHEGKLVDESRLFYDFSLPLKNYSYTLEHSERIHRPSGKYVTIKFSARFRLRAKGTLLTVFTNYTLIEDTAVIDQNEIEEREEFDFEEIDSRRPFPIYAIGRGPIELYVQCFEI